MRKLYYLVVILLLGIIALGATGCQITNPPSTAGAAEITSQQNTGIWVTGEGKVMVVPDVSLLNVGVEVQEATVAQAQSEASASMNAVVSELRNNGVAERDIQTRQFSIYPVRTIDEETRREVLVGYRVSNVVTAKIRQINNTGTIIDAVVRAGGDNIRIDSIGFTVDNPAPYQSQARDLAMADARARAEQLAEAADVSLGRPTYINESLGYYPPPIIQFPGAAAAPAPAPTPISAGEVQITINVQVVYSIS